MAENGRFVGPRGPNFNPLFTVFLLITYKCSKKHHNKKSDEFIHYKIKVQKTANMAKKLFVLEGQISFKCRLLNMGKNIIFKNQKNHSKCKVQKTAKMAKNGWLFLSWRADFLPFFTIF